jgi:hypothetical protein
VQKQVMRNQSGSAFGAPISPARRRLGKKPGNTPGKKLGKTSVKPPGRPSELTGRRVRNIPRKHDRMPPINRNDAGGADPTASSYNADLAFQRAMQSAIARGLERPPLVGVARDLRPLTAPQLFEPVPRSSGCTSPAQECAELAAQKT